eukprot:SAG31_NODE_6069_length_2184_cov_3.764988_1_plen_411_part_00
MLAAVLMLVADSLANAHAAVATPVMNGLGVDVFIHGERAVNNNVTYPCIRIPSLIGVGGGNLVAFAECRFSCGDECWPKKLEGTCWGSHGPLSQIGAAGSPRGGDICMKRSSDSGATWSGLRMIGANGRSPSGLFDPVTETITLAYSNYTSFNMALTHSSDGGLTWTPIRSIDMAAGVANHSAFQPGTGVQLVGGPHTGRKLWTLWGQVVGKKEMVATSPLRVIWTDDNFKSFGSTDVPGYGGPSGFVGGAEAHLVQLSPSKLLLTIRGGLNASAQAPDSTACGCKGCSCLTSAYSTSGGMSWSVAEPNPALLQPSCMCSTFHASDGCSYLSGPGTRYNHDPGDPTDPFHGGWCHGPRTPTGVRIPGAYSLCGRFNGVISRSVDGSRWSSRVNVSVGEEFGYSSLGQVGL